MPHEPTQFARHSDRASRTATASSAAAEGIAASSERGSTTTPSRHTLHPRSRYPWFRCLLLPRLPPVHQRQHSHLQATSMQLIICIQFDESQATLITAKAQQLSEFLKASGITVTTTADEQTLEWLDQQKPVTAIEEGDRNG